MLDVQRLLAATSLVHVEHHPSLASTNDRARELSAEKPPLPLLVVADEQTAGRGREDRSWWTGRGNLAMSLLLDPTEFGLGRELLPRVSLATAVAIIETVRPRIPSDVELGLHWPNDVFAAGGKLGGVLVEGPGDGRLIVGIGLNTNGSLDEAPTEVRRSATSLRDLTGRTHDHTELLRGLIHYLTAALNQLAQRPDDYGRQFDRFNLQHGRTLQVRHGREIITGTCEAVDVDGALVLSTAGGTRRIYSGSLVKDT